MDKKLVSGHRCDLTAVKSERGGLLHPGEEKTTGGLGGIDLLSSIEKKELDERHQLQVGAREIWQK